jgi:hypothetical protein
MGAGVVAIEESIAKGAGVAATEESITKGASVAAAKAEAAKSMHRSEGLYRELWLDDVEFQQT